MIGALLAAVSGVSFALGLILGGMTTPGKVTAFLDFGGAWDPQLAFVMGGAVAVYATLFRLIGRRRAPWFDIRFHHPTRTALDLPLLSGAALFGIGWGLSGYCPGPALTSLPGGAGPLVFVAAMIAGISLARLVAGPRS